MNQQPLNDTANKILDVAENLTQTEGFNAFSYKDIQAEVGVKTSSIHYYFPTKQDLAVALVERYIDRFLEQLNTINNTHQNCVDRLLALGDVFLNVANDHKICLCAMLTSDMLSLPEEGTRELRGFYKKTEAWLANIIREGISNGELKDTICPDSAASVYFATLEGGLLIARVRNNSAYFKTVIDQQLNLLR